MSCMRSETELSQFPRISLPTLAYKLNEATSGNHVMDLGFEVNDLIS